LYELPGTVLAAPKPLSAADAYEMASHYFVEWLPSIDRSLATAATQTAQGENDLGWRKDAAFMLHQAVERAYICYLLSRVQYVPRSHNIKFLRSLAEDKESRLIGSWPRATKIDRRRFELAKSAYVDARYASDYEISTDDLTAITMAVRSLRDTVETVSREWLETLRQKAAYNLPETVLCHSASRKASSLFCGSKRANCWARAAILRVMWAYRPALSGTTHPDPDKALSDEPSASSLSHWVRLDEISKAD
jgi:HEPN domain-containing protein